jgi:hypothetical protein
VGPEVLCGLVVYPADAARDVLRHYRDCCQTAPDDLTVWCVMRKAPPLPFLRLSDVFARHLDLVGLNDCQGVMNRLIELEPAALVVPSVRAGQCVTMIEAIAKGAGYQPSERSWYFATHTGSGVSGGLMGRGWRIYRHPGRGPS